MGRQTFPDTWASGGSKTDPGSVKTTAGWVVEAPPLEFFNFWQNKADQMLQYYERNGIAEYDAATVYDIGGLTKVGGIAFKSKVGSNTGNTPTTSPTEWEVAYLIPANNLSDLENAGTARTNLDVYSKGEVDGAFLEEGNNLSDVADAATARTNLDVYSKTEANDNFLDEASNLSDLTSVSVARTNLDVYSKGEADSNFLDAANDLSDLADDPTARTNLDVYSKLEVDDAIDLAAFMQTEGSSFKAQQEQRLSKYTGSGFIEYGKLNNAVQWEAVNEGLAGLTNSANTVKAGRTDGIGTSRTDDPVVNVNGVLHAIRNVNQSNVSFVDNTFTLPPAPDGTVTYDRATGITTTHADPATAFASLEKVTNGSFDTTDDWTLNGSVSISGGLLTFATAAIGDSAIQDIAGVSGEDYLVTLTVSGFTSGSIRLRIGDSGNFDISPLTNGVHSIIVSATGTDLKIIGQGTTPTYSIDSIQVTKVGEDVVTSRKDFIFLETWHELIDDKDIVYPFGNVQYGATTWESVVLSNTIVVQGYSAFGEWDTVTTGWGVVWSTLSDVNKQKFLGDDKANIFLNVEGNLTQVRYRVRVLEGFGDTWEFIDTQGSGIISYDSNTETRIKIRQGNTIVDDFSTVINLSYRPSTDSSVSLSTKNTGAYGVNNEAGVDALRQFAQAIPIALVQRRNTGAYHPAVNKYGARAFFRDSDNSLQPWYVLQGYTATTADAFRAAVDGTNGGFFNLSGQIGFASGRPDDLLYDAITAADVTDLRNSSRADDKPVDFWLNKAVANDLRYYVNEGTPFTTAYHDVDVEGSGTSASTAELLIVGIDAIASTGDFIVIYDDEVGFNRAGYRSSSAVGTLVRVAATLTDALAGTNDILATRTNGATYKILVVEFRTHERETLTWTDVVGDPAQYPRQWTGVINFKTDEGSQTVATGDTIEQVTAATGGTIGNVYLRLTAGFTGDLDLNNYSNATQWQNLGTKAEFLANATGFQGFPLLFDENGGSLIPSGSLQDFKMSRKVIKGLDQVFTDDSGVAWTVSTTWNTPIEGASNSNNTTDVVDRVRLVWYETPAHIFTDAISSAVFRGVLGTAKALNNSAVDVGSGIVSDLIDKVSIGGASPWSQTKNLEDYDISNTFNLRTNANFKPKHSVITISGASPIAAKLFTYQVEVSNQLQLHAVFKEMIFDTGFDSVADFTSIDGTTTQSFTAGVYYKVTGLGTDIAVLCVSNATFTFSDQTLLANGDWVNDTGTVFFTTWNGNGFGDDNQFLITDNTATETDDNGNTILLGTKSTKLPFFVREES